MKRSLCSLTVVTGGPSAFESQWQHWTVKRSLCALTVLTGGSICLGVCIFIYALVFPYIFYLPCLLVSMTTIEQWRDHYVSDSVDLGGPYGFECQCNIEQWRDALVFLWHLRLLSASWVSMTTFKSEEITLFSDSCEGGVHMPLVSVSLYMHWCFVIFSSICLLVSMTTFNCEEISLSSDSGDGGFICLWVSMTTLNSEEITLCSDSVYHGGVHLPLVSVSLYICTGISLYFLISWLFRMGSHLRHWTPKSSLSALAVSTGGRACLNTSSAKFELPDV